MRNLTHFFVTNPKLTFILTLFLMIYGFLGIKKMNAESYPSVDFATAIIETEYFGATPDDIEVKITKPIEDEIRGVNGLKDVRSTSQAGKSKIVVRVDMDNPKIIVKDVMADIQRAIDKAKDLPVDLQEKPKFTEIKSEEFAAMEIAIVGDNSNRARDLIADALKEDIEDDKNVKEVRLSGYREREFEIKLSRQKLDEYHIGVDEVLNKIGARNINIPGGEIENSEYQKLVKVDGKIRNTKDLSYIPIRSNLSGQIIYLKDIAQITDGQQDPGTLNRYMSEEATVITINKKGGADTLKLVDNISPLLERYKKQYPNFKFIITNDEGVKVKAKLETLSSNAVSGLLIVVCVLIFFIPGRLGVMAAISLPVSLLATMGLMPSFGLTLNSITILALIIAMGMLVDNAVVISAEYTRRRQMGLSSLDAAVDTVTTMWIPITATAFTTIAAFLPMLVTTGIMGRFIYAIPVVVTTALVFCLIECFFLLPMRIHFVSANMKLEVDETTKSNWFDKVTDKFEIFMGYVVDHRYITAIVICGIISFSFFMIASANKFMLFPAEQTEIYMARLELPENTKIEKTHEITKDLELRIQKALGPELLKHSISYAGTSQGMPTDPRGQFGENVALIKMYATDHAKYNVHYLDYLKILREIKVPEANKVTFEEQINGPPVGSPVTVTFRSNNSDSLNGLIAHVTRMLSETNGVFDVEVDDVYGPNEIVVNLDYDKLDRLGLTTATVGNTIRTALTGSFISDVTLNNKKAELKVNFGDVSKQDVDDLKNIKIMDSKGNLVPLSLLATFDEIRGTAQVKRLDYKRAKTVTANVDTSIITSVIANGLVAETFKKYSPEHTDVSMVFGGEQESTNESMASLGNALILAMIGIYAIMVYIFRSYLAPGLIMTTTLLGLLGVSISFWAHGRPISFMSMIGIIGLAGIIVNNGIILIDFINQMKDEGKMALRDILIKAPSIRLRPVVATSVTTMGGLFPTAYGIGGQDAMLIPMTMAMAWGLTTGTILTLIWIPAGFAIIEDMVSFTKKFINFTKRKLGFEIKETNQSELSV